MKGDLNPPIECKEASDDPPLSWDDLLDLHISWQGRKGATRSEHESEAICNRLWSPGPIGIKL